MAGLGNIDDVYNHYLKVIEENKQLKAKLDIAVEALESLRTKKTVIDKVTGDVYYIWDYALEQIKESDK